VFNDAAEPARDEEHLYVSLVQTVHEIPGEEIMKFKKSFSEKKKVVLV